MSSILADNIKLDRDSNDGRISKGFIENLAEHGNVTFSHPHKKVRVCVIEIYSGHVVVGVARVIDEKFDDEHLGNQAAYNDAVSKLWEVCGIIAVDSL